MANQASSFIQGSGSGATAYQAAAQTGPQTNVNDLFDGLLPFSWRGIQFPIVETEIELRQDLAIHKFVDRDGAHVEGTGRAPLQITARIPFLNGLTRGKQEQWYSPLYPSAWRQVFAACADKSSGVVQHPELGQLTCKCEFMRTRWAADTRQGVYVNITWIETDDAVLNFDLALASASPLANAQQAAADMDQQVLTLNPKITPQPYVPPTSFSDLMNAVRGVIDIPTLLQKQFMGRVDNVIYESQALEDSLNRAINATALNWPMFLAAELAKSACYDLKATQLNKGKKMGNYVVQKDSTLAQVSASIGASVSEIMSLNPAYVQFPVIAKDSIVRYYLVAA